MKKPLSTAVAMIGVMFFSQGAMADFRVRAGQVNNDYKIDFSSRTPTYGGKHGTVGLQATTIGGTYLARSGDYLDLAVTTSDDTKLDLSPYQKQPFSREEQTLTWGNFSDPGSSFFVGYKAAKTTINKDTIEASGLFMGGSAATPALGGRLGFGWSLLAIFSGDLKLANGTQRSRDGGGAYSLGVNYTYMFTPMFGTTLDYKWQRYEHKFETPDNNYNTVTDNPSEEMAGLGLTLFAHF